MTKKETKGRSVVFSIIVLMLCFAMLLGTTYAWFTDSKYTAINKVKSGTLKIDIVDAYNSSLVGQTLGFVAADGRAQDAILWEPGCTYKVQDFYILNTGKMALKYKVNVNGIKGDAKLLEVIDWTNTQNGTKLEDQEFYLLPGERSKAISIIGHMQESAGNEYQDLEADGIGITVVATQYTYEKDSNSDQYDKTAEYPVADAQEFISAINHASTEKTTVINLMKDIDVSALTKEQGGTTRSGDGIEVPVGAKIVVNGAVGEGENAKPTEIKLDHTAFNFYDINEGVKGNTSLEFNNVKFTAKTPGSGYAVCTGFDFIGTVKFNNCEFNGLYTAIYCNQHTSGDYSTIIIKDCKYTDPGYGYSVYPSDGTAHVNVTFEGNTGLAAEKIQEKW